MDAVNNSKPEWAWNKRDRDNAARVAAGLKPKRRIWPWIVLGLIVLAIIGFVAMQAMQPAPVPETAEVAADPVMQLNTSEVLTLEPRLLERTVKVTGPLAPQRQAELASQASGRVIDVKVRPGEAVAAGDVLVEIDPESLRIQLEQQRSTAEATRAQLALAESQLERTEMLIDRGLSSAAALEQARSSAEALRANLAALEGQVATAEIALQNATVVAPFDGIISARSAEPGQTVMAGASLLSIVDLGVMEMQASAPVGASAQIAPDQRVEIAVEGLADRSFAGTVDRVNPVALAGTRTIPVYVTLDNPEGLLRGGMFATGQIVIAERASGLAVPVAAIREDASGFYVLKLEANSLVRQPIEQGERWNNGRLAEVTSGLAAGDMIVAAALPELSEGDRIEMVNF